MQRVFVADTPAQAHLVAGLLDEAGIDAVVEGEFLTGVRFDLATDASTLPSVSVREADVGRARELIREHREAAVDDSAGELRPAGAPADDESRGQSSAMKWFKRGMVVWIAFPCVAGVIALVPYAPEVALAIALATALVVVWLRRRPRRATVEPAASQAVAATGPAPDPPSAGPGS